MVELTFLEVHLDGAEFTANAPFRSGKRSRETGGAGGLLPGRGGGSDETESAAEGGTSLSAIVFAFVGLVVATVVLRRILGGSGEPVIES